MSCAEEREGIEKRGEEDRREEGETNQKWSNESANERFLCIAGCSQDCMALCEEIILKIKPRYCDIDFSFKKFTSHNPKF